MNTYKRCVIIKEPGAWGGSVGRVFIVRTGGSEIVMWTVFIFPLKFCFHILFIN